MLGGTSGARFVVNFSIEGSGERDLQKIAGLFKGINKSISGTETGAPASGKGIVAGLDGGLEAMEKMAEAGAGLMELGTGIVETWGRGFETLLHKGGELETMWLRLQTASGKTGEQAFETMSKAVHLAQKLPFTESELVRLLDAGAVAHLDIMKDVGKSYDEIAKKGGTIADLPKIMGEKMKTTKATMASMFADVFAKAGVESGYRQQAMHELSVWMETGKMGASQLKRILGHDWAEVEAKSKGGHGSAEALQEWLIKHHALGAGQVQMETYDAALQKFKGIIDLVTNSIMEPGKSDGLLKLITRSMLDLYQTIAEFFDETTEKGRAFLGTLKGTFSMVGGWMVSATAALGKALKVVFTFIGDHPLLVKFAAGLSIVAAVVLVATGAFLVASAAVGGLIITLLAMPEVLLAPLAILGLFPPVMAGLLIAGAALGAMWLAWDRDLGGLKTTFLDVKLVVEAVIEAFEDWQGGMSSISEDTAQALEKRGLMGAFLKIINVIRQAEMFYEGFMDGFQARWQEAAPRFERAWGAISTSVSQILQAVEAVLGAFGMMVHTGQDAVTDAASSGEIWGDRLGHVAELIGEAAQVTAYWMARLVGEAPAIIAKFAEWYQIGLELLSVMSLLWNTSATGWHLIAGGAAVALATIAPLADILWGIVKALSLIQQGEFSEAWSSMGETVSKASGDALKYNKIASEQFAAAYGTLKKADTAYTELSEGDAKKKADALKDAATWSLTGERGGHKRGEELPTYNGRYFSRHDAGERPAYDRATDSAAQLAGARQRAHLPQIQHTTIVQLDREVLGKAVSKFNSDQHEQGGGHKDHL